ncbi:aspartic peptidase domain-containing protein [Gamsiella multidivaricata]|uniref:aspartic peptidase domain-containing protein n=1 Tax=Gamsiella multidivaricata TaxID=101098 RepID=UPI0022205E99|nr:aspartic peptidase domain-containing protein [Gamsiella multidivaricata]KAI7818474.1 aspartic peptidase domain-containing protein [Gamsiella multidivaricata]
MIPTTRVFALLATVLLLLTPFLASPHSPLGSNSNIGIHYPDVSDLDSKAVVRFSLHRTELSPSALSRRATMSVEHTEPVVQVSLTTVPKEYGYTATFSLGTFRSTTQPGQQQHQQEHFNLLVDTGSDLVVVVSSECKYPECVSMSHRYNASASITARPTQNRLTGTYRWAQLYGDGTVANGSLVSDTIRFVSSSGTATLAGTDTKIRTGMGMEMETMLEVKDQTVLVVDQPGLRLFKSYGAGVDGIIGLNLQSPIIAATVVQNLQEAEHLASSTLSREAYPASSGLRIWDDGTKGMGFMSLWLSGSMERGKGGELLLNAVDRAKFRGEIRWSDRGPSPYDWAVQLDRGLLLRDAGTSASVVGTTWTVPGSDGSYAVIDSGSDGIYLPREMYDALFKQVPGSKQLANGYWRVPCEGTLEFCMGIGGAVYRIPYEEWVKKSDLGTSGGLPGMCQAKVFGSSPGPVLLGTAFLRSVYTVFDFSRPGYERVGFAALA